MDYDLRQVDQPLPSRRSARGAVEDVCVCTLCESLGFVRVRVSRQRKPSNQPVAFPLEFPQELLRDDPGSSLGLDLLLFCPLVMAAGFTQVLVSRHDTVGLLPPLGGLWEVFTLNADVSASSSRSASLERRPLRCLSVDLIIRKHSEPFQLIKHLLRLPVGSV